MQTYFITPGLQPIYFLLGRVLAMKMSLKCILRLILTINVNFINIIQSYDWRCKFSLPLSLAWSI